SMVSWNQAGDIIVGSASKRQMVTNARRTVYGVKRLIGRPLDAPDVRRLVKTLPYELVAAKNADAWSKIDDREASPQEISAHILRKMKQIAEEYLGQDINEAIVTVPAYFD